MRLEEAVIGPNHPVREVVEWVDRVGDMEESDCPEENLYGWRNGRISNIGGTDS